MSRPEGSKNFTNYSFQHPTRCHACDSTRRTKYENGHTIESVTTLGNGLGITHTTRQNTRCMNCGIPRIDVTYHNCPAGEAPVELEDTGFTRVTPLHTEKPAKSGKAKKSSAV